MTDLTRLAADLEVAARELPAEQLPELASALAGAAARVQLRISAAAVAPASTGEHLVGAAEMARLLGVPENWVRDRARAGTLPFHRLGHYVRFNTTEVLEAVRRMPRLHDSDFRGPKKHQENRGGRRRVSTECPHGVAAISADGVPTP